MIPLFALLLAGCATAPLFTVQQIDSIEIGFTTREQILKTFGEPKSLSVSHLDGCGKVPAVKYESFLYYRMIGGYSYYDSAHTDSLSITLTNGVVKDWNKSH